METKLKLNDSLPTLYVDAVVLYHREDKFNFLRCISTLPEGNLEQARLMIDDAHFRSILDYLCKISGYYPNPDKNKEVSQTQNIQTKK